MLQLMRPAEKLLDIIISEAEMRRRRNGKNPFELAIKKNGAQEQLKAEQRKEEIMRTREATYTDYG